MANFLRSGLGTMLSPLGSMIVGSKKPPPPPTMPDPNDPAFIASNRQTAARAAQAAGSRQSTIMTGAGGNYQSQSLGG